MTDKLPRRSIELLTAINASGRYFEFYAARNYFDRAYDHDKTALHALSKSRMTGTADEKYVVPAYELRRALNLARTTNGGDGEAFKIVYTPLPSTLTTPTQWKAYVGTRVVLSEEGHGAAATCYLEEPGMLSLLTRKACDPSEIGLQPPPSRMMRKLLHPYPTPLLEGAGDGQHCTT